MGTLKPGATYVYERTGDKVYAREFGKTERKLVGYTHMTDPRTNEIHRAALTNPALQTALDRVIMIYRLSKDNPL